MIELQHKLEGKSRVDFREGVSTLSTLDPILAKEILNRMAEDSRDIIRSRALEAMLILDPSEAESLAIRSLEDNDWVVRTTAINTLTQLKSSGGIRAAERIVLNDPDEVVRGWALFYLGRFASHTSIPVLRECSSSDKGVDHEGRRNSELAEDAITRILSRASGEGGR